MAAPLKLSPDGQSLESETPAALFPVRPESRQGLGIRDGRMRNPAALLGINDESSFARVSGPYVGREPQDGSESTSGEVRPHSLTRSKGLACGSCGGEASSKIDEATSVFCA
jgi:hypothetical protein